ncbi:MAG: sigma-54 dependent transcriptional regulator [Candidatus Zixiibacteriota bacterium]
MSMRVLLADDDLALRRVVQFKLKQKGYEVTAVANAEEALFELKRGRFDLLLSDMKMPGLSGLELLEMVKKSQPDIEVILMTAYAAVSQAVQAVKLGAFDYLTKPFEDEQLFVTIEKAVKFRSLEQENKRLKEQLKAERSSRPMVGVSKPFRELVALVEKIAPTDATVLLTGESGTGKELIAREIHRLSARSGGPFVAVNCAAIPKDLLESELFGHVKGAFTGAVKDKRGKFELAAGGTLLLDEISELNVELQAKLLRAIQERVIDPVGSEQHTEIDVRLIASTNVNLKERVSGGTFREDLFYRLNVIPIEVPALRRRQEDILILARSFARQFAGGQELPFAADLADRLVKYDWPGNIRELENLIERMVILRHSDTLTVDDLPRDFAVDSPARPSTSDVPIAGHLTFHEAEKKLVLEALARFAWNKSRAADYLKIPRHVLIYRMKKYGLSGSGPELD